MQYPISITSLHHKHSTLRAASVASLHQKHFTLRAAASVTEHALLLSSQVQENCIDLVGRVADRGAEFVPAREWMRICFELLEMLKAHKKGIRRATVNTFGYIAKAIGPQDVLVTLLNNLKVQERQNRVCTTVAIAIVAETCSPFTVLPALMNEYKVSITLKQTVCQDPAHTLCADILSHTCKIAAKDC